MIFKTCTDLRSCIQQLDFIRWGSRWAIAAVSLGVTTVTDGSKRDMELAVVAFTERLADRGTGLFEYAGHGTLTAGATAVAGMCY